MACVHTHTEHVCLSYIQGLVAEVEILAKDLLKIDRSAKQMKDALGDSLAAKDAQFFANVEAFVNEYAT